MESRTKYLFKNTAIFTIGNFETKVISFLEYMNNNVTDTNN